MLLVIKDWRWEQPVNEATHAPQICRIVTPPLAANVQ